MKPPSIARFEQVYVASILLGWINAGLNWPASQARLAANPALAPIVAWLLPAMQVVSIVIAFLLWYFIVRRPTVVAKWVQVVFAAFAAIGVVSALGFIAAGRATVTPAAIVGLVANVLYITAAVLLFRPDARLWLGEEPDEDDYEEAPRI